MASSCVVFVHPVGTWSEPVNLELHDESLNGVRVELRCLDESGMNNSSSQACVSLGKSLTVLGADIGVQEDEEGPKKKFDPDLTVTYQDISHSTGVCGWSLIPMMASLSIFPCNATANVKAQLLITNHHGGQTQVWPLQLKLDRYVGIGALYFLVADSLKSEPRASYHVQLAKNFQRYFQNKAYTVAASQGGGK